MLHAFYAGDQLKERQVSLLMKPIHNAFDNDDKSDIRELAASIWFKLICCVCNDLGKYWEPLMNLLPSILTDSSVSVRAYGYRFLQHIGKPSAHQPKLLPKDLIMSDKMLSKFQFRFDVEVALRNVSDVFDCIYEAISSQHERVLQKEERMVDIPLPKVFSSVFFLVCLRVRDMHASGSDIEVTRVLNALIELIIALTECSPAVRMVPQGETIEWARLAIVAQFARMMVSSLNASLLNAVTFKQVDGHRGDSLSTTLIRLLLSAGGSKCPPAILVDKLMIAFPNKVSCFD
jgi:hypothetical protein